MVQIGDQNSIDELKNQIKRLNSKAGQLKMDLHDLAEGLPTNYELIMELAAQTYEVYRQLNEMKQELKIREQRKRSEIYLNSIGS